MPKKPTPSAAPAAPQNAVAFEQLRAELEALPVDRLRSYRGLSPKRSALEAWRIARASQQDGVRQRFEALAAAGEIPKNSPDRLALVAQAVLHLARTLDQGASESRARVPAKLIEESHALRARMLKVLEYAFGDDTDSKMPARLAHIREGSGHLDLAEDLTDLAALYVEHKAQLGKEGGRHYRPSDEADARSRSAALLDLLTAHHPVDSVVWKQLLRRAMTLLQDTYDDVKAAGRLFYRHEDPEARYPTLQAIGRASGKGDAEDEPEEDEQGSEKPEGLPGKRRIRGKPAPAPVLPGFHEAPG